MNTNDIELLLEKFYEGETSVKEEAMLRDYFNSNDVPKYLEHVKIQFNYYTDETGIGASPELEQKITDCLNNKPQAKIFSLNRRFYYTVSAVAASVIIMLGAFNLFYDSMPEVNPVNTYQDPEIAYKETAKVLMMLSGKMNKGMNGVEKISKLDSYFNKVFKK